MTSRRADRLLVERGLFESRAKAQAAIAAGRVTADDLPVRKASDEIPIGAALRAEPAHPWVSRGGVKLAAALDHFRFDPAGHICLDVGASTGGFTQVLLARGAKRVYAVDVGRGQLHPRLRDAPGIVALEETDIRNLDAARLPEPPDFLTVDVSFISLKLVLPPALALLRPPARLIALVKPQFEAGRRHLKKGIVRDPQVHAAVCEDIAGFVTARGWTVAGIVPSPITGGDGNREFLLGASAANPKFAPQLPRVRVRTSGSKRH
jgi:23S rRNA (cytidine1920-2'-O)/16S rRNA (cytidine1409-2'-O)-methyltransferase